MKRISTLFIAVCTSIIMMAQGWPEKYEGVMLQGFYWDSYSQSQWVKLERQADELSQYFSLIWIPQSAQAANSPSMGYNPLYWFPGHYNSSFGTEKELRSMIKTFKEKNIGTIADVVINHCGNVSNWVDFPSETYKGVTYQLQSTDICANDDNGKTKEWATSNGYSLSSNNDTGEDFFGLRDLDHKSENVKKNVKAYLDMLLNDLGYSGFRYDVAKGFSAEYFGQYNTDANPTYSVGEYFDGNLSRVKNWIDGTGKMSAAFDFPFRYTVRNALRGSSNDNNTKNWNQAADFTLLGSNSLISTNDYKRYSITFVENHDTEKRSNADQDPIKKDTLAANAYLLAMPGTPCVFFRHWIDCKKDIKAMIDVRHAVGIHNESASIAFATQKTYYAVCTTGNNGKLIAVVGSNPDGYSANANFVKVLSGYHYIYYMEKSLNTAWADLPSGEYEGKQQVLLTAVSTNSDAQLVYTTDGTEPTAQSNKVPSGTKIDVEGDMTLKVGILIGSTVSGIVTRNYSAASTASKRIINIYVNTDKVNWTTVNFWSWGGDDSHSPGNKNWPGDKITTTTEVGGKLWFTKQYTINADDDFVNFVFSTGSGSPQTIDINNVTTDKFFEISTEKSESKHKVNDLTETYATGIQTVNNRSSLANASANIYSLDGRLVSSDGNLNNLPKGIYITNGKKIVKR